MFLARRAAECTPWLFLFTESKDKEGLQRNDDTFVEKQ
jgi:hypothetical protein